MLVDLKSVQRPLLCRPFVVLLLGTSALFAGSFDLPSPDRQVKAIEFLKDGTSSDAIERALASRKNPEEFLSVVLDTQDWIIDRAILLPSNTELIIDGCTLKLADHVFDNIIRSAGVHPNPDDPNGVCLSVDPVKNLKIIGLNKAVIEGADHPYVAPNPKSGVSEKWVGDYFGWRTVGILLSKVSHYEIAGLTIQKTHCWAISQDTGCRYGYLHDIVFNTRVKNGDGIDFRNGSAHCLVENISGTTSDDTVACTALNINVALLKSPYTKYIWSMQTMGFPGEGADSEETDIHDITIRNITTTGANHGVICLTTSPKIYNITIENVIEETPSDRQACVKIYTGYGSGYKKGNLSKIAVRNVVSLGAKYAVMVNAAVKDVFFENIQQHKQDGVTHQFTGKSENLSIK